MADRVSASITLGGMITAADYTELSQIIAGQSLSVEWDGPLFEPGHRTAGEPLRLYAHEVAWGRFEALESWCVNRKLPFARWSGACASQWGAERVVFTGDGDPVPYAATDDDEVVIDRPTVEKLGSIEEILAWFDTADIAIPALVVDGEAHRV